MARFAEEDLEQGVPRHVRRVEEPASSHAERAAGASGDALARRVVPAAGSGARAAMAPSAVLRLQRSVGNAGTTAYLQRDDLDAGRSEHDGHDHSPTSPVHSTIASGGSPLDRETRDTMEGHLGADLSSVRLHVDRSSAESVQAAAYTVGNDVVVHPDHYRPGTPAAQRTLAHELTHVVQQRSGPVDGTERDGGIKVSDPSDRFEREAESSAERFMATSAAVQTLRTAQASGATGFSRLPSVQREEQSESEDEEVQKLSLQRQADEEESESEE